MHFWLHTFRMVLLLRSYCSSLMSSFYIEKNPRFSQVFSWYFQISNFTPAQMSNEEVNSKFKSWSVTFPNRTHLLTFYTWQKWYFTPSHPDISLLDGLNQNRIPASLLWKRLRHNLGTIRKNRGLECDARFISSVHCESFLWFQCINHERIL